MDSLISYYKSNRCITFGKILEVVLVDVGTQSYTWYCKSLSSTTDQMEKNGIFTVNGLMSKCKFFFSFF